MLSAERQKLVTDMLVKYPRPLAFAVARLPKIVISLRIMEVEDDEINSIMIEGIVKAARNFDDSRGVQFSTLALKYATKALLNAIQHRSTKGRANPGHRVKFENYLIPHTMPIQHDQREQVELILKHVDNLRPRYRKAVMLHSGLEGGRPHKLHEIGSALGVTRERARQIIKKAREELSHKLRNSVPSHYLSVCATDSK